MELINSFVFICFIRIFFALFSKFLIINIQKNEKKLTLIINVSLIGNITVYLILPNKNHVFIYTN